MAVELASAYISLIPSAKGIAGNLRKELSAPAKQASTEAAKAIEDGLAGGGEKGAKRAGASIGGLLASAAVLAGMKKLGDAASELQQSVGATGAVFGEAGEAVDTFAKGAAESVGLSERAAREATASVGALLKGFGASADEAAEQSIRLAEIGADLAATFGGTTTDAVNALTAALRGEGDPAERFGISLRAASIEAKAVELGLVGAGEEVDAYSKSQAAMALILEQTTDAQGQFARESGTAAGQTQIATARMEDASAALGQSLLPIMASGAELAGNFAEGLANLPTPLLNISLAVAALVAVAGPAASGITAVSGAVTGLNAAVGRLATASLTTQVGAITAALGLAAIAISTFRSGNEEAEEAAESWTSALRGAKGELTGIARALVTEKLSDFSGELTEVGSGFEEASEQITGSTKAFNDYLQRLADTGEASEDLVNTLVRQRSGFLDAAAAQFEFATANGATVDDILDVAEAAGLSERNLATLSSLLEDGTVSAEELGRAGFDVTGVLDGLPDVMDPVVDGAGDMAGAIGEAADETETFADRLSDAVSSLSDLFGFFAGLELSQVAFRDGIRSAWQEVESLNREAADPSSRRDAFTKFLTDQADLAVKVGEAMAAEGATTEEVAVEVARLTEEAAEMGAEFGLSRGEVDGLREALGLTNGTVVDVVVKSNLGEVGDQAARLKADLDALQLMGVLPAAGSGIHRRAEGGPVVAGTPYIVGERRPELFVPDTSGYIVPEVPALGEAPSLTIIGQPGEWEKAIARHLARNVADDYQRGLAARLG